jgi:S-(hydroxymethyl)glutathione dehydrogenase / alcohol dehydrogenase
LPRSAGRRRIQRSIQRVACSGRPGVDLAPGPTLRRMRAAVLLDSSTLVITDVSVAAPTGREVLVKTVAVGLCHSDAHVLSGMLVRPRPIVLGHESAGIVEAVGPDVRGIAIGDHVVTCLVMGCGQCASCEEGAPNRCEQPVATKRSAAAAPRLSGDGAAVGQMANIGALGEQLLVDERALVRIPTDVPMNVAAILGCAVVTGLGAVLNVAKVQTGQTVAVFGCGGVGLSTIQGARIAGASRIIAVDLNDEKLAFAKQVGATDLINAGTVDPVAAIIEMTGRGVDHAFEVVGHAQTVRQAFDSAAPGKYAYAVGIHADDAELSVPAVGLRRGKSLVGIFMGDTQPSVDIPRYIEFWRQGLLDLEAMISHVVPLEQVNEGFAMMAAGHGARTVVTFAE